MENLRHFTPWFIHTQPMVQVMSSVVSEERAHRKRIMHNCTALDSQEIVNNKHFHYSKSTSAFVKKKLTLNSAAAVASELTDAPTKTPCFQLRAS